MELSNSSIGSWLMLIVSIISIAVTWVTVYSAVRFGVKHGMESQDKNSKEQTNISCNKIHIWYTVFVDGRKQLSKER